MQYYRKYNIAGVEMVMNGAHNAFEKSTVIIVYYYYYY